jgi:nucleoside-triphosphatase THEP1
MRSEKENKMTADEIIAEIVGEGDVETGFKMLDIERREQQALIRKKRYSQIQIKPRR